jgi:hypothetical protein
MQSEKMRKVKYLLFLLPICIRAQQPVTIANTPAVTQSGGPWTDNVTTWAGQTLGATAVVNYGSTPAAVLVPAVNAYVTNASAIGAPTPSTSSTYALLVANNASMAAANIKASAGNLYMLDLYNNGTIPCFAQLFNTAGTPTAGTSVVDSFGVQAGTARTILAGSFAIENFATGIAIAGATTQSGGTTTGCTTTFSWSAHYF